MMKDKTDRLQSLAEEMGVIPLHFDVPEHHLPLNQFIDAAVSTQTIIDNFNREFFENKLEYQIHVITPKEGGLFELLQIIVPVAAPIWIFLCTDIGKAYIKDLTGKEPSSWAEIAGKKTKKYFSDENNRQPGEQAEKKKESSEFEQEEQKLASVIVVQMTLGFLQREPDELRKLGVSKEKFSAAYKAKNNIYQECINNQEVQGLGFDMTHDFPIKRKDFPRYIVDVPSEQEKEIEENPKWIIDTPDIIVNSPNWKRDGRKWQAETGKFKNVAFTIEDETFWYHVNIKDIKPNINLITTNAQPMLEDVVA